MKYAQCEFSEKKTFHTSLSWKGDGGGGGDLLKRGKTLNKIK